MLALFTSSKQKLSDWLRAHKLDVLLALLLLAVGGTVSAINLTGYPQRFEDEGTYVSQAWAVKERGTLTHYTYWYDHPPAGWIQIAGWFAGTDALGRYGSAITAGREFMLVIHLATIVLLFALARRLKIGSVAAALGVAAFALSPLAVEFSRYVLLDNVALPWLLAAFVLALSPRRSLAAAIGSAVCMAIALLSKETFLVLLPILLYTLWGNGDKRNRRYVLTAFGVIFIMVSGLYILYATLKKELFPGPGHVSLLGTFFWQLFGREGSGNVLDATSGSRGLIGYWLNIDYWLLLLGTIALPVSLFVKRLRPAGLALLLGLILLLRPGGYLPYPYVIALMPFAALTLAGAIDVLIIKQLTVRSKNSKTTKTRTVKPTARHLAAAFGAIALVLVSVAWIVPAWQPKLQALTHDDQDASSRQAVSWIGQNIGRDNRVVVESALWTDLETQGFDKPQPVWLYKTETDPEVTKEVGGWQGIDYVVLNGPTVGAASFSQSFPTVSSAIQHGQLIQEFGQDNQKILIYKVQH